MSETSNDPTEAIESPQSERTALQVPPQAPPRFQTPLAIRLFMVAALLFLFKLTYDAATLGQENQQAIAQISKQLNTLSNSINESNRGIERLNGGFSDIVKGVGRMGSDVSKSSRNVQMIQNDLHEELSSIQKKVAEISDRVNTIQQDLRNPFRR